jgi:hypothetical protein
MHNHLHNPYFCDYPDCERAKAPNGFPRKWNQRDHMKRVHGWLHPSEESERGRRRIAPPSVPMRRSGSEKSRPRPPQPYSKDSRTVMYTSKEQDGTWRTGMQINLAETEVPDPRLDRSQGSAGPEPATADVAA